MNKKNALLLSMLLLTVALIIPYSVPNVSPEPEEGLGLPVDPSFHHFDLVDPRCIEEPELGFQWQGLYPHCVQCREYELSDWKDSNNSGEIDVCDGILLVDKEDGQESWYHVEYITVTMNVTLKPDLEEWMCIEINATKEEFLSYWQFNPVGTQWHEVKHNFSNWYNLTLWFDTNPNGFLDADDQIMLALKDPVTHEIIGPELEYHVEWITTNLVLRPSEPWWFLPASWHFKTGLGSSREILLLTQWDEEIPPVLFVNSTDKMTFDMHASAPDASGVSTITIPQESIWVQKFFLMYVVSCISCPVLHLWCNITAVEDGTGKLDTVGGNLDADVFTTVTGDGAGGFTTEREYKHNVTGQAQGDMISFLNLSLQIWTAVSDEDPTPTFCAGDIQLNITVPLELYITTGFSRCRVKDPTPYPGTGPDLDGKQINGTGVPADPYDASFTGVATEAMLDTFTIAKAAVLGACIDVDLYIDILFKETLVGTPSPPIPPEPIQKIVKKPTRVYPIGGLVNCSAWMYNGLASYNASGNGTTYAKNLKTGVESVINVTYNALVQPMSTRVISFLWNVTEVEYGRIYKLRLEVFGKVPMPDKGKTYTFHDEYIDCTVTVVQFGDFDLDLDVDVSDYYIFVGSYPTDPAVDPLCDYNGDNKVDVSDYYQFAGNYPSTFP